MAPSPFLHGLPDCLQLEADIAAATRAVPPLWPLSSSVAVNPFLGQTGMTLSAASHLLSKAAGIKATMPRGWYAAHLERGDIADEDLQAALDASAHEARPASLEALKAQARQSAPAATALPTIADIAAAHSGIDWPGIAAERIGVWAAAYFDEGQALWALPKKGSAFAAWRAAAMHDLVPEILGLRGFAARVADAPQQPLLAISDALNALDITADERKLYLHRLMMTLGGWAQYARHVVWQAELKGQSNEVLSDLLAIRLIWEEALYAQYEKEIAGAWDKALAGYANSENAPADFVIDEILQEALERSHQRKLKLQLEPQSAQKTKLGKRAPFHAIFCIDVRSEVFRRALESVRPDVRTSGFAGFFGLPVSHAGFASDVTEKRLPILLNPGVHSCAGHNHEEDTHARLSARAVRAWGRFKLAAVSSFAFVEATGPLYAAKLLRDALRFKPKPFIEVQKPEFSPELDREARVQTAEKVLRAMSLTSGFARIVLLAGHGAAVSNNPHASALHCGACGGHAGDVNARLLASLLNDTDVRAGLAGRGISLPADTLFLAGLHDTTTDEVVLFEEDVPATMHEEDIKKLKASLEEAGVLARTERALRLPGRPAQGDIAKRSHNWAEVRPEWALAGCNTFIAAPRSVTRACNLSGRSFLHDYDWRKDEAFGVLELIMTAPVVVASWISLQYYGSTVAPDVFGGGNKLLHNVTGGIGVLEGSGGLLRGGLPWQSVHDGEKPMHNPLRLSVCIQAPTDAMTEILRRNPQIRDLFDNKWLHLFALNEDGQMSWRYAGDLTWAHEPAAAAAPLPVMEAAE